MQDQTKFPSVFKGVWFMNRLRGHFHGVVLTRVSRWYGAKKGLKNDSSIYPLPFNLVLKRLSRTREQEALAMAAARKMGIPVPKVIQFGHDGKFGSILMTRVPGKPLSEVYRSLSDEELHTIAEELKDYVYRMRKYRNPWGARICSVNGGPIFGHQMPHGRIDPCEGEDTFHAKYLQHAHPNSWIYTHLSFDDHLASAKVLAAMKDHSVFFTHGDLLPHNIMIEDGHVSGIVDWEFSGWMPEYWEYTSMLRSGKLDGWWPRQVMSAFEYPYQTELHAFNAMWKLAESTFTW